MIGQETDLAKSAEWEPGEICPFVGPLIRVLGILQRVPECEYS